MKLSQEQLLNLKEAAEYFGLPVTFLLKLIEAGKLPSNIYFDRESLDRARRRRARARRKAGN